jgi:hypothetical protein
MTSCESSSERRVEVKLREHRVTLMLELVFWVIFETNQLMDIL